MTNGCLSLKCLFSVICYKKTFKRSTAPNDYSFYKDISPQDKYL